MLGCLFQRGSANAIALPNLRVFVVLGVLSVNQHSRRSLLLITYHLLLITYYLSLLTSYLLLITYYLLLITSYFLLLTSYSLLTPQRSQNLTVLSSLSSLRCFRHSSFFRLFQPIRNTFSRKSTYTHNCTRTSTLKSFCQC
jgi:hypothetical protein